MRTARRMDSGLGYSFYFAFLVHIFAKILEAFPFGLKGHSEAFGKGGEPPIIWNIARIHLAGFR